MVYIILVDMRTSSHSGEIVAISHCSSPSSEDEEIVTFKTGEEAAALMEKHSLRVFPYEIVGLDFEGHVEKFPFVDP